MPMIHINGLRFHYQQRGQGPDVVLIHALTSNLAVWLFSNLMDELAVHYRVTAYDLRGHGATEASVGNYTSADMADDLHELYSALKLQPALLVGHSFGGVVAMHAAVSYPNIVRGIILSDSFFPGLAHLEPDLAEMANWREVREALVGAGASLDKNLDLTRLFSVVAGMSAQQKEHFARTMGQSSLRWLSQLPRLAPTSCGRDVFAPAGLTAERICQVRQPVVALYDEYTSFHATREFLAANLQNVCVEIVPGAQHVAPLQSADAFGQLVQKHCRSIDAALRTGTLVDAVSEASRPA